MKVLVGFSKGWDEKQPYVMKIVDTDLLEKTNTRATNETEEVDIDKLKQCVNIVVNDNNFKSSFQNPKEYISASFDVERLIGWGIKQGDFQITNVYYDDNNLPQLFRAVNSSGYVTMHDISELKYMRFSSVLGKTLEELPDFVKKEPLEAAYEWWKAKDEMGKKAQYKWLSGMFETYEEMPVKLLYHYLTGVKGFKLGFHTVTTVKVEGLPENKHEYMLYKGTANIKLSECIPTHDFVRYSFSGDSYPEKRKLNYYGATMSFIFDRTKPYPEYDWQCCPSSKSIYDENGIEITIDARDGMFYLYNKFEEAGCISDEWRLGENSDLYGMSWSSLLPSELALMSCRLQSEKEDVPYGHVMVQTRGHWSSANTDQWMKTVALPISTQYFAPEFKQQITPLLENYSLLYLKELSRMIERLGAADAFEAMQWTKKMAKEVLADITLVKPDGEFQESDLSIVDRLNNLFIFKRNDYDLPAIESLGGAELLKETINNKGEEFSKNALTNLAEGIESERRELKYDQNNRITSSTDFLLDGNILQDAGFKI